MDQRVVVGVGNIYAAEALFAAGISPLRAAGRISRERYARLAEAVKAILAYAITRGGTTLRDFISPDGAPGYFEQELSAYGRGGEPCPRCGRRCCGRRRSASARRCGAGTASGSRRRFRAICRAARRSVSASQRRAIVRPIATGDTMADTAEITVLLDAARDGDRGALDRVLATLYQELHTMARRQLAGQHGHTLDATALVHEAYLKLIGRARGAVRRPRAFLRLRRFGHAQRGGGLRPPAPGAEARWRPAPRHRPARGPRRRRAPGRGDARPGHRADAPGRGRCEAGAGGGAALFRRPVRA